jgi:hypothetical protein
MKIVKIFLISFILKNEAYSSNKHNLVFGENYYTDSTIKLNYINYHALVNKAELNLFNGNLKESQKLYSEATNNYPKPFINDLINASIVTLVNKNKTNGIELIKKCFELGVPLNLLLKKKIIKKKLGKRKIIDIYKMTKTEYLNTQPRVLIDSLLKLDQTYRRNNNDLKVVDKNNTDLLYKLVKNNNFPNEYRIGYHQTFFLLFLHNSFFWGKDENYNLLMEELKKGNIHPSVLALIKDREKLFKTQFKERFYYLPYDFIINGKLTFNSSVIPIDNFINNELLNQINERRNEIGLKNVEDCQKLNHKKFRKKYQLMSNKFI